MDAQAKRLGVEIKSGDVTSIENNKNYFTIKTSNDEYSCKAVILAAGSSYRHLNIPGEMEFRGKGVSYCGTCDAPFFKNKIVAVIGGGSTALEEALFLTKFAAKVILIHRRDEFRGEKVLQDKIRSEKNIELLLSRAPIQIEGAEKVSSLIVKNLKTGNNETINVDGVFIFVGVTPNSSVFSDELKNSNGEIITDINMKTKIPGIFAAGDIRESSKRQIVTACGDGAVAAITAYEFITGFGH